MLGNRLPRSAQVLVGVARAQLGGLVDGEPGRDVAVERVVRCGLVGDEVEALTSTSELGDDLGRIAEEADRERAFFRGRLAHARDSLVE